MSGFSWSSVASRGSASAIAASAVSAAAKVTRVAENLDQRSIYVRVQPTPQTLSERRSVLHLLERHGKADLFKQMNDNSSFIAIASTVNMAHTLIESSPMQYEYLSDAFETVQPWQPDVASAAQAVHTGRADSIPESSFAGQRRDGSSNGAASNEDDNDGNDVTLASSSRQPQDQKAATARHVDRKSFVVSVFPSEKYNHREMIRQSPLHGPWPRDDPLDPHVYKRTYVYNALREAVPDGPAMESLCDWRVRGSGAGPLTDQARVEQRRTQKQGRKDMRAGLSGLVRLAEEDLKQRRAKQQARREAREALIAEGKFVPPPPRRRKKTDNDAKDEEEKEPTESEEWERLLSSAEYQRRTSPFRRFSEKSSLSEADNPFMRTTEMPKSEADAQPQNTEASKAKTPKDSDDKNDFYEQGADKGGTSREEIDAKRTWVWFTGTSTAPGSGELDFGFQIAGSG